jgi:excinuclease UvrABC ATPase subunit
MHPADSLPMHDAIELRGVATHNLKKIDVQIPHRAMTVISGVSGSGKSSLAFDTLYAEGQRRFLESLSTYARQFLQRMEKPPVELVRHLLPAVALEQKNSIRHGPSPSWPTISSSCTPTSGSRPAPPAARWSARTPPRPSPPT